MSSHSQSLAVPSDSNRPGILTASIVCLLGAMFYLYEFVIQVSPSVMTQQLMRDLSVDAAGLGIISSAYYYAYTPMQLPAGLLYDRFGPRILITIMVTVCALGAFFFGVTDTVWLAALGRFLMGIGSAFAFIGVAMLVARWFPPAYFACLLGIAQLMSSVGAITGEVALSPLVQTYGWRQSINVTAAVGLVLALVVWLVVRDGPNGKLVSEKLKKDEVGEWRRLKSVLAGHQMWLIALYGFMVWAPILVFASLWGNPFLMAHYGFDDNTAANLIAMIWIGIGVGSPLGGWWSDRIGRRCFPLAVFGFIGVVSALFVLFFTLPIPLLYLVMFAFGFAAGGQTLAFGLVKDIVRPESVGTAVGFTNLAVVAGGMILQPLTGFILRFNWEGRMLDGIPVYTAQDYRIALLAVPVCYFIAMLVSFTSLKETHCKPLH